MKLLQVTPPAAAQQTVIPEMSFICVMAVALLGHWQKRTPNIALHHPDSELHPATAQHKSAAGSSSLQEIQAMECCIHLDSMDVCAKLHLNSYISFDLKGAWGWGGVSVSSM